MNRARTTTFFAAALAIAASCARAQSWPDAPPNLVQATATIFTSGQPPAKSLEGLKARGFEAVVYLAPPTVSDAVRDEARIVGCQINLRASSMTFLYRAIVLREAPDEAWKAVEKIWSPVGPWKKLVEEQL